MDTRTAQIVAAAASLVGGVPGRIGGWSRRTEKYPGQRSAYLVGAWRGDSVPSVRRVKPRKHRVR